MLQTLHPGYLLLAAAPPWACQVDQGWPDPSVIMVRSEMAITHGLHEGDQIVVFLPRLLLCAIARGPHVDRYPRSIPS
jgi:hypothetical protein